MRRKEMEFRLKIDHAKFLGSDSEQRKHLIVAALKRSIQQMPEFGVENEDCNQLTKVLDEILTQDK